MKKPIVLLMLLVMALAMSACAPKPAEPKPASLAQVYESIQAAVSLPPMLEVDSDLALDFYGIDTAQCSQHVLMLAEDSLIADEILLLEAKDQAAADAIKAMLQSRLDAKAAEAITYSPEQYAIIQKGHLVQNGLHLALIVSPDADKILSLYQSGLNLNK